MFIKKWEKKEGKSQKIYNQLQRQLDINFYWHVWIDSKVFKFYRKSKYSVDYRHKYSNVEYQKIRTWSDHDRQPNQGDIQYFDIQYKILT